jgi:hypothetical protein
MKIEFESLEEMKDYFDGEDVEIISRRYTGSGYLVEFQYPQKKPEIVEERRFYLVCFPTNNYNNPMYWGQNKTTFNSKEKALFTQKQARDKVKYMASTYDWQIAAI